MSKNLEALAERIHLKKSDPVPNLSHVRGIDFILSRLSREAMGAVALSGHAARIGEAGQLTTYHLAAFVVDDPLLAEELKREAIAMVNENDDMEDETPPVAIGKRRFVEVVQRTKDILIAADDYASSENRKITRPDIYRAILMDDINQIEAAAEVTEQAMLTTLVPFKAFEMHEPVGVMASVRRNPYDLLQILDQNVGAIDGRYGMKITQDQLVTAR